MITLDDVSPYLEQWHEYNGHAWCLCPFHPDTRPSFSVGEHGFKCWSSSCGKKGSLEYLYSYVSGKIVTKERVPNPASWIWMDWAKKFGSYKEIAKYAHTNLVSNPQYGSYLEKRKLVEYIKPGMFGYLEGYYLFPIFDRYKQVQGLTARASPTIQTKNNRYSVTRDCPVPFYTPNWRRLNNPDSLYLCYGTLDVWTLEMLEFPAITGLSGLEFNPEHLDDYRCPIYLIPDKGEEKSVLDLQCRLGWRGMMLQIDWPEDAKDLNELYVKYGLDTVSSLLENAKRRYDYELA